MMSIRRLRIRLIGHYKIGGYYDTSTVADIANSKVEVAGHYTGYLLLDQMIYSFAPGTARGIIVFGDATMSDKETVLMEIYFDTGVIFRGMLASRPNDTLALGWIAANANTRKLNEEDIAVHGRRSRPLRKRRGAILDLVEGLSHV